MHTPVDPLARFGAMIMMLVVASLAIISAYDHRATRTVQANGPALRATPRLIVVVQTPTAAPTDVPAPTATAQPTTEPQIVYVEGPVEVQYVYVPAEVPVEVPATLAPPPIAAPTATAGETVVQPPATEPESRFGGRRNLNPGPPDRHGSVGAPEAVGP